MTRQTPRSIRARLLAILLSATGGVWLVTTTASYLDTRHEVGEMFDAQLAQGARTLLSLSSHELSELRGTEPGGGHVHFMPDDLGSVTGRRHEHRVVYQIWSAGSGKLLIRSDQAPTRALSEIRYGFSDQRVQGQRWRIYSLSGKDSDLIVQIGESYRDRDKLINDAVLRTSLPMLFALPVLGLFIWFGVGRSLAPLTRLAREIGSRAPNRLEPMQETEAPQEIAPLIDALNHLFDRLQQAFDNERRFTADAAHELRTPLAALRTQAEVALRAQDDASRAQSLRQVLRGVDRATRLVEQLLTLARLDPETGLQQTAPVDLCAAAMETLAELAGSAAQKRIELSLSEPCDGRVDGHAASLAILLRNLVDNAIRYTPAGGNVAVTVRHDGAQVVLEVADSGAGIPEEERQRVFDRFFRRPGSEATGSGLGLSIVRRIVELHHGAIELDRAALGGLLVRIRLPGV